MVISEHRAIATDLNGRIGRQYSSSAKMMYYVLLKSSLVSGDIYADYQRIFSGTFTFYEHLLEWYRDTRDRLLLILERILNFLYAGLVVQFEIMDPLVLCANLRDLLTFLQLYSRSSFCEHLSSLFTYFLLFKPLGLGIDGTLNLFRELFGLHLRTLAAGGHGLYEVHGIFLPT